MCKSFCHLHNHSEYSLLDGANRIKGMVKRAADLEMPALALTDHGVMFGAMGFYWAAKEAGIKPIIGMEAYVSPDGIASRKRNEYAHLLLLAKDLDGYRNLCKLATISALEGYYQKPRIDHDILRRHTKGLISSTTCLGSEVNGALMEDDYAKAIRIAEMYADMFGEGNYFVELMDHGLPLQQKVNEDLRKIARELKLPTIVTNDAHYGTREDAKPHDLLLCIQLGKQLDDPKRFRFESDEFYLKEGREMAEVFPNDGAALEMTAHIADLCNVELDKQRAPMPQPEIPEGVDAGAYLRQLCEEGVAARCRPSDEVRERLDYELDVIEKCGFNEYMLLVREFAQATRERDIYFGVRGSAAGSLVAYATGITDVDPVDYGLTFERFLNPERISMPDIDMDFEDQRRGEIIDWVVERYGKDRVAQIVTFGTLGAKAVIKDVGRVLGFEPRETDALTKKIPVRPGTTLDDAYGVAEFREMIESSARNRELFDSARRLEGLARSPGVHAAGVVISRDPLVDMIPLSRGTDGQAVTAYEMKILEKMGMLKMDFLGLSNLTVLAKAVANIEKTTGTKIDVKNLPEEDPATWEMLARGESAGVFQLEGDGMTRWLCQLKPTSIRELAALIALYRPGPMGEIPRFIEQKFQRRRIELIHPLMEPILRETYGVIVYQDQVLLLVQALAGFTLGKADNLRRAMGKKDAKAMAAMEGEFYAGTDERGIPRPDAHAIWELLKPFAGYAFNKAHSVCYAILSFQTAWLKANYPHEYMAALLAVYRDKEDRIVSFIEDCRRRKIPVWRPDVNLSVTDFGIQTSPTGEKAIRFGLGAIKGVGVGLCDAIVAEREANGPYTHLYEFAERTKGFNMNRGALDALIKSGALDDVDPNRAKLIRYADAALAYADGRQRDRERELTSLFEGGEDVDRVHYPALPDEPAPARLEKLAMEKESTGAYISDHPLRGLEGAIARSSNMKCSEAIDLPDGSTLRLAGILSDVRTTLTKRGDPMCSLKIEDFTGQVPLTAFTATFQKFRPIFKKDTAVRIVGRVRYRERDGEREFGISVEEIAPLDTQGVNVIETDAAAMGQLVVTLSRATRAEIARLVELLRTARGDYRVRIVVDPITDHPPIDLPFYVANDDGLRRSIEEAVRGARVEVELNERAFAAA